MVNQTDIRRQLNQRRSQLAVARQQYQRKQQRLNQQKNLIAQQERLLQSQQAVRNLSMIQRQDLQSQLSQQQQALGQRQQQLNQFGSQIETAQSRIQNIGQQLREIRIAQKLGLAREGRVRQSAGELQERQLNQAIGDIESQLGQSLGGQERENVITQLQQGQTIVSPEAISIPDTQIQSNIPQVQISSVDFPQSVLPGVTSGQLEVVNVLEPATRPSGLAGMNFDVQRRLSELNTKRLRGQSLSTSERAELTALGFVGGGTQTLINLAQIGSITPEQIRELSLTPEGRKRLREGVSESFANIGETARVNPEQFVGEVAFDVGTFLLGGRAGGEGSRIALEALDYPIFNTRFVTQDLVSQGDNLFFRGVAQTEQKNLLFPNKQFISGGLTQLQTGEIVGDIIPFRSATIAVTSEPASFVDLATGRTFTRFGEPIGSAAAEVGQITKESLSLPIGRVEFGAFRPPTVATISAKEMKQIVGQADVRGFFAPQGYIAAINEGLSPELAAKISLHEQGHAFSRAFRIGQSLNKQERAELLKKASIHLKKKYGSNIPYRSEQYISEYLADLYRGEIPTSEIFVGSPIEQGFSFQSLGRSKVLGERGQGTFISGGFGGDVTDQFGFLVSRSRRIKSEPPVSLLGGGGEEALGITRRSPTEIEPGTISIRPAQVQRKQLSFEDLAKQQQQLAIERTLRERALQQASERGTQVGQVATAGMLSVETNTLSSRPTSQFAGQGTYERTQEFAPSILPNVTPPQNQFLSLGVSPIQLPVLSTGISQIPTSAQATSQITPQQEISSPDQTATQVPAETQQPRLRQVQQPGLSLRERQALRLRLRQAQRQQLRQSQRRIPRQAIRPRIPRITIPTRRQESISSRTSGEDMFGDIQPQIRRFGKWLNIGEPASFSQAKRKAIRRADETLGASIRLRSGGETISFGQLPRGFRISKSDPLVAVERRSKRLSTGSELKEIKTFKKGKKPKLM